MIMITDSMVIFFMASLKELLNTKNGLTWVKTATKKAQLFVPKKIIGRSQPQELEEGLHSGPYPLVWSRGKV